MSNHRIHQAKVQAAERAVIDSLPSDLGISADEFARRMNSQYVWPIVDGRRLPQGDCSACRQIDARHPEGSACDYSCVGV